MPFSK